jgi:tRNA nucleotidyltransferase (CCA-adding enzyme)
MFEKSADDILNVFDKSDAWRRPERFIQMLLVCKCDFLGRKNFAQRAYPQHEHWIALLEKLNSIDVKSIVEQGLQGPQIKLAIHEQRLQMIETYISEVGKPQAPLR